MRPSSCPPPSRSCCLLLSPVSALSLQTICVFSARGLQFAPTSRVCSGLAAHFVHFHYGFFFLPVCQLLASAQRWPGLGLGRTLVFERKLLLRSFLFGWLVALPQ